MLRIHVEDTPDQVRVRLEGKLVEPWVDELVRIWAELSGRVPGAQSCCIDLEAVSYVDECGKGMLCVLHRAGCELHGSGPFIAAVIEEIETNGSH